MFTAWASPLERWLRRHAAPRRDHQALRGRRGLARRRRLAESQGRTAKEVLPGLQGGSKDQV